MNPRLTLALLACTGLLLACPTPPVPDVDECLTDNGGCATNATCTNTPGSFQCACNAGYTGDGKTCADVDECLTNNGACSPNATCTNTVGSRSCTCAAGYVGDGVMCRRYIANGDFTDDFSGWVKEGSCLAETQIVQDDTVHGKALALGLGGAVGCDTTKLWQVAALDVSGRSSVRIRADVKMMQSYVYTGAINLRVYTGSAPSYDQQLIGNHVFQVGALSETSALDGTTSLPLGSWYAWTSENIKPLLPAGAQYLRVELWIQGNGTYGWSRVDNVILVVDDTAIPTVDMSADVTSGHPPFTARFTSTCSDTGGRCASHTWDFGDGPIEHGSPGGGSTATVANPTNTFSQPGTFQVSYTVEDDQGAASTVFRTLTATNAPPTVSIDATSSGGTGSLNVQFTSTTTDDHQLASHAWDFGDGTTSTAVNPAHTYATPGTYKATLKVTDDHGLSATASYTVVVRGATPLGNGDFSSELKGWVAEGKCLGETQVLTDDVVHGRALGFGLGGAVDCDTTKVWQVAAVDVAAASSVRIRADVKMMQSYVYTGPIHLRVYAGTAPSYDQQLIGNHVFQVGTLSETSALDGTTSLPLGSWYAWTSDDLEPLLPSGTQYLRVELWIQGRGTYGWARVDNVKVVLDDPTIPTASTSADVTTGHPPLTVRFTGTCTDSDGTCTAHAWDFGDAPTQTSTSGGGGASSSPSPTYTFQNAGTFQVGYTVEDNRGAARTVFRTITTINQPPAPAISATPANGPAPLAIQFTGTAVDDHQVASYAWEFGDGASSTAQNPSHTYANPGTYLVKLTATDDHGATGSATYTVVVTGGTPLANGNFSNEFKGWVTEGNCLGETQVRGDDDVHGRALGFGLGGAVDCSAVKVSQVAAVDVAAASSVRIRADVKMMQSYFYHGPIHLRVYAGTAPSYDQRLIGTHVFEVSPLAESSALTGTTSLPLGTWYAWTSDDLKPLLPAGTKFLRVELWIQGRGSYGWARVDNVKVVLNDPSLPSVAFMRNPASGSAPLAVQFHGTCSDPDSPCAAFAWDFGDGAVDTFTSSGGGSATSTSPSYTFTGSRTYTVSFTAEDAHGGARSVLSSVSTVNSPPSASIQASPGVGSAPLTVRFTGTASDADGTVISYAWNFGDGSSATVQNPSHTFTKQGTYNVSFTVTDERGAFTTATTTIIVQ